MQGPTAGSTANSGTTHRGDRGTPRVDQRVLGRVVERVGEHLFLDAAGIGWVLDEPARGAAHGFARGHDVAVTEPIVQHV